MRNVLAVSVALIAAGWLFYLEYAVHADHRADFDFAKAGCVYCHGPAQDQAGTDHPVFELGCTPCHLGNGYTLDKRRAHHEMIRNPGDLRYARFTCGRRDCHPDVTSRVMNSVMATNSGIIRAMYRLWDIQGDVSAGAAWRRTARDGLAQDYYVKMCSSCHLWWPRDHGLGEQRQRGGGCSACHVVGETKGPGQDLETIRHAGITTSIPTANCVRCHNRSARVGLTYQGMLEDDGYGTPHHQGGPGRRRLSGRRFYLQIPADVHFQAGMMCIDCHTGTGVMGDGQSHASLREQLDIRCRDCHMPRFTYLQALPDETKAANARHSALPPLDDARLASTRKGSLLYALRLVQEPAENRGQGLARLYRKADGKALEIRFYKPQQAHHAMPGHERLGCQACHSHTAPQCFGCHVTMDGRTTQHDKLLGRETTGKWREYRSYTRFESPQLAFSGDGRIMPVSPCQVFITVYGPDGSYMPGLSREMTSIACLDPHSTQKASRTCLDCHLNPKTLGLGSGFFTPRQAKPFRPAYDAAASGFGSPIPPDRFVDLQGRALQAFPVANSRPLNAGELRNTLGVSQCLACHREYADPIYKRFQESMSALRQGRSPGCAYNGYGFGKTDQ